MGKLKSGFASFGEQLRSIRAFELRSPFTNAQLDPRQEALHQRSTPAGSSERAPSDGGFLIAPEFSRQLLKRATKVGEIFGRCFQVPTTSGESWNFPYFDESSRATGSRLGGVQVFAASDGDMAIPTKPALGLGKVPIHKLIGFINCTDELGQDSDAFNTWALYAFTQELVFTVEDWIINGSGLGRPLGIVGSPACIVTAKDAGQVAATVSTTNITAMSSRLWSASRRSAVWLFNQALRPQLSTLVQPVNGGGSASPLWSSSGGTDFLDGIPAVESEYCAAPGTQGDLILADFARYALAIREFIRGELSLDVRFLTDEQVYRFVVRIGGQPIDSRPVVPKNGTVTTSPFVVLAAR